MFRISRDDVLVQARINFYGLALKGELLAIDALREFQETLINNPNQSLLKKAAAIAADKNEVLSLVREYQNKLKNQGADISVYALNAEEKQKLRDETFAMILTHGDPVADRKFSWNLSVKVTTVSIVAASFVIPVADILLGHPIEKFDRYWNPFFIKQQNESDAKPFVVTVSRDQFGAIHSIQFPKSFPVALIKTVITDREEMTRPDFPPRAIRGSRSAHHGNQSPSPHH